MLRVILIFCTLFLIYSNGKQYLVKTGKFAENINILLITNVFAKSQISEEQPQCSLTFFEPMTSNPLNLRACKLIALILMKMSQLTKKFTDKRTDQQTQ